MVCREDSIQKTESLRSMVSNTLKDALSRLDRHIGTIPAELQQYSQDKLLSPYAPGKWTRIQVLGHLIDSAINNLKRFTESQYLPQPYTVIRYQQDELVAVNDYHHLPLEHVLVLWAALNRQILYVAARIPAEKLSYTIIIPSGEHKTLEWLIIDYVEHMEHHLEQIRN
jgi:DinB family protein